MGILGLLLIVAAVGFLTSRYAAARVNGVALRGTPAARRSARRVQKRAAAATAGLSGKAAEVVAQAMATEFLEHHRHRRARRDARPSLAGRARGVAAVIRTARRRPAAAPVTITPAAPGSHPGPEGRPSPPSPPAGTGASPQPAAPAAGRTTPVTTPISGPPGAGADLFVAVQQILAAATAGRMRAKYRAIATLGDGTDYISGQVDSFGTQMAEPGNHYGPPVWEPLKRAAAHYKAAVAALGESASAIAALSNMKVGELEDSGVTVPHHDELGGG